MNEEGLSGARRGRAFKVTTISDENQHRPRDLVDRQFAASEPNSGFSITILTARSRSSGEYRVDLDME